MKRTINAIMVAIPMLGGCLQLEQAPLVYTSKVEMGVGVTVGQPETPGLHVNIGFKGVDTALVPVVFAKHCGEKAASGCNNANYNAMTIIGTNKLSAADLIDQESIKQFQQAIKANQDLLEKNAQSLVDEERQLAEISTLPAKKKKLADSKSKVLSTSPSDPQTVVPAVEEPTAEQIVEIATLTAEIDRLEEAEKRTGAIDAEVTRLNVSNITAAASVSSNRESLHHYLSLRNNKSGDDKTDALSVYGSFNGKATGDKDGAGLNLGKVFSTGIAAQFIAQGLRQSAPINAVTECIRSGDKLLTQNNVSRTEATINALLASCKRTEKD